MKIIASAVLCMLTVQYHCSINLSGLNFIASLGEVQVRMRICTSWTRRWGLGDFGADLNADFTDQSICFLHPKREMDAALRDHCHWFKIEPLMAVARRLNEDDAHTLSFIYSVETPGTCTTTLSKVLHVFKFLEKEGHLRPDRTGWTFLLKLLDDIPRLDIKDYIVKKYPEQGICMHS